MPRTTLRPNCLDFQPRPTYPYSPGAGGGDMVFTAGQVAWDETGEVTGIGDVAAQTQQTLKNVVAVLHLKLINWLQKMVSMCQLQMEKILN